MLWHRAMRLPSTLGVLAAVLVFACNDAPTDLRPWRATDHDHTENPNADQVQVTDAGASEPGHGLDDVTIAAWKQNCTSCHGPIGRGDGPQGPMVHAADLSRAEWQASVTDEQIAATIRQGKGRMPGFALPDATVQRLVALVRMLDAGRMEQAMAAANAPKGAPPSAAAGSAAPAASSATKAPAAPASSARSNVKSN